jgi:hypothetical protein
LALLCAEFYHWVIGNLFSIFEVLKLLLFAKHVLGVQTTVERNPCTTI